MKRKVSRLRLSPNEEAQLIREEHERRRKLRIQQVREQERFIALQIRRDVQQRRDRELHNLAEELKKEWEQQQREKLETLQKLYQDNLRVLGEGHRSAKENEVDWGAISHKNEDNHVRAEERYREALKELKSQRQKQQEELNRSIEARKKAIQVEKERAAKVANLPPLPPNPFENIESKTLPPVKKSDVAGFSVTHYHMPETAVDREVDTKQPNACELAMEEAERLQELGQESLREKQEQLEKARLRGNHALRKEQLTQDRERLLVELEHMQQTDLRRRRQVVAQMPAQIFQPLYRRQEMREDRQRDMEFAFEDMYTGERRVKGDLVLQLVPEPLLAKSTSSHDEDLDLSLNEDSPHLTTSAVDEEGGASEQVQEPSRPAGVAPRQALKRLLNRIRSQRDQWSSSRQGDPLLDQQTTQTAEHALVADAVTIETGSLASEERERSLSTSPRPTDPSGPSQETTEESIVAGTLLQLDEHATKINAFEIERRKREEELERQKQEQIALLEELEEKRSRLEGMLQEAQLEKEELQMALTQETTALSGTRDTVDQERVSPVPPAPQTAVATAAEDEHSRRIRQYQQRLVEQNRLHKQSVEEARQRLAEYQCTLRNRHSVASVAKPRPPVSTVKCPAQHQGHFHGGIIPPADPLEVSSGSAMHPCPLTAPSRAFSLYFPTCEASVPSPTLFPPGLDLEPTISSNTVPVQPEPIAGCFVERGSAVTAWLADSVFKKITGDLREGLSASSSSLKPQSHRPPPDALHPPAHFPPGADLPLNVSPAVPRQPPNPQDEVAGKHVPAPLPEQLERQQLREARRRVEAQREALLLHQRQLEGEQRRKQREALQSLLTADDTRQAQPNVPGGLPRPLEVAGTERLSLMAALLRAIEESNGPAPSAKGNLSQDSTLNIQAPLPDRPSPHPVAHPRAARPPVARPKLGFMDTMMEPHELSAIQEVETPVNTSIISAPEDGVRQSRVKRAGPEEQGPSESIPSTTCLSSAGERSAGAWSDGSSKLSWRQRLYLEAGGSPEPEPAASLPKQSHSYEYVRGVAGKSVPELESLSVQSAHRTSESDYLSSTTISSGSYATTDPEPSSTRIEPSSTRIAAGGGGRASSARSSTSPRLSSCWESSGTGSPITESLLHNSSIQRIIDKYTRDLNLSLIGAGNTTGSSEVSEGSGCEGSSCSLSHQKSWSKLLQQNQGPVTGADSHPNPSDTESGALRPIQDWDNKISRITDLLSDKSSSLALEQGRHSTITPLIGQSSFQSSCLVVDQGRNSTVGQMIGQPSAQSSTLGMDLEVDNTMSNVNAQLTGQSTPLNLRWNSTLSSMIGQFSAQSTSLEQGWDSNLRRMIGRFSNQSTSQSQLIGQIGLDLSPLWLHEGQEESQLMRSLLGELDESAVQQRADGSNSLGWVDLEGSGQTGVSSDPAAGPEAQSLSSSSPPGLDPPHFDYQILQRSGASSQGTDRTRVESDSFHPLQAEVTHNETSEPVATTFHPADEEVDGSRSSGADGSNSLGWVDLEGSGQTAVSSDPAAGPEDQSLSSSGPSGLDPPHLHYQSLQQSGASSLETDRTRGGQSSDFFYPLPAEVTQNQTAELSMTFHLPEVEIDESCFHNEETGRDAPVGSLELSVCPEEIRDHTESSVSSDPSPERLRGEQPPQPSWQDNQLSRSQRLVQDSPDEDMVQLAACSLSGLSLCEDLPTVDLPAEGMKTATTPQEADGDCAVPSEDIRAGEAQLCLASSPAIWERILEVGSVKGIMDESALTLVSLADTTLQGHDLTLPEEEDGDMKVLKETDSALLPEENTGVTPPHHAVMLLEFQPCSSVNLQEAFQQKRRALIQRSARRVEEIQAKRAEPKAKTNTRTQSDPTEPKAETNTRTQSDPTEAKTNTRTQSDPTEPKAKTNTRTQFDPTTVQPSKAKPRSALSSHRVDNKQKKPNSQDRLKPSVPVNEAKLNKVGEVRISTPETRKQDSTEMRQRTHRLYSRLEEVKHQKEIRVRQEAYAHNREKAKEFHKKTLQKLRAKQTL
ncbi:hypothetical protein UPYG_G00202380 [Umbra pygmaea]|uniref:ALMS motif domain-containing protein n=1 Tax=Umbra pygmaea TaxID=75934 RepID=A0ABD0WIJ0_UMBPY